MEIPRTAPQTDQIPLAKQQPARVQLHRPDFDNGMKTHNGQMFQYRTFVAPPGL
ncbi:hypothetical protein [Methylobacter tundripaludum]|uniref:hypothetical protein n=1 Tax=Methylobacter tundripaludum TaxID=173365 RepID=UPI0001E51E52